MCIKQADNTELLSAFILASNTLLYRDLATVSGSTSHNLSVGVKVINNHDLDSGGYTRSFIYLLGYALPYSLSYILLVYFLSKLGLTLDVFLLVLFTIFVLSFVTITVFYKCQHRLLQKIECNRIALLSATLLLIMSILFMIQFFGGFEFTWSELSMVGFQNFIVIGAVLVFVVNYMLIFFSLWLMQKCWRR